jgi:hypothetical protein
MKYATKTFAGYSTNNYSPFGSDNDFAEFAS